MLKKISRQLFAAVFIVMTLVSTMMPASAANVALPDPTRTGSITIHKFQIAEDEWSTLPSASGVEIDKNDASIKDRVRLENVEFKITKIEARDASNPVNLENYVVDSSFTARTQATDSNGETTFSNLPLGFYLIEEIANPLVTVMCDPFIVAVPMTNPLNGNEFMYDIHAYPKNSLEALPGISKSVTNLGNTHETIGTLGTEDLATRDAKYILTAELPSDLAICNKFAVHDQIDARLTYVAGQTVKATAFGGPNRASAKNVALTMGTDFTVTEPGANRTLTVELTKAGMEKAAAVLPGTGAPEKAVLDIEFTAKANAGMTNDANLGINVDNKCTLEYVNSFVQEWTFESNVVEVHTAGVKLKKVDGNSMATLPGAQFKIYNTEADAKAGTNAIKDVDGNDLIATSDANGVVEFRGLPYGGTGDAYNSEADRTYWVVEVQAPIVDGQYYELLRSPFEVTANRVSHLTENIVTVKNYLPHALPNTGLTTHNFLAIGLGVMAVAGIGMIVAANVAAKKKKNV